MQPALRPVPKFDGQVKIQPKWSLCINSLPSCFKTLNLLLRGLFLAHRIYYQDVIMFNYLCETIFRPCRKFNTFKNSSCTIILRSGYFNEKLCQRDQRQELYLNLYPSMGIFQTSSKLFWKNVAITVFLEWWNFRLPLR